MILRWRNKLKDKSPSKDYIYIFVSNNQYFLTCRLYLFFDDGPFYVLSRKDLDVVLICGRFKVH